MNLFKGMYDNQVKVFPLRYFPECVELNLADNNQFIKFFFFETYNLLLEEIIMRVVINTLEL